MSTLKVNVTYDGINEREEVDAVERNLKALDTAEVETVGISAAQMSYDPAALDTEDIEAAVTDAGGNVRSIDRIE